MERKSKKIAVFILSVLLTFFVGLALMIASAPKKTFGYQNDGYVYLSDLYPSEKSVVFYDNIAIDMDYPNGNPSSWSNKEISLLVNGTRNSFSKGIVIQANGSATYDIENMKVTRFSAKVGVSANGGTCQFVVKVDGETKFTSSVLNYNSNVEEIDVSIPDGAKSLTIEVQDGGDNADNDHGAFAEPKLYCGYADLSDVSPVRVVNGYNPVTFNESKKLINSIGQGDDGSYLTKPTFQKTINAHANSEVEYDIEGMSVKKFTTMFGINADTSGGNGVVFTVKADGVEMASKTILSQEQFGFFSINVPDNAKKITLIASDNGNLDYDHAIWVNPRIYNFTSNFVDKLEIAIDSQIVEPNDNFKVGVNFLDAFGAKINSEDYAYSLESSDSSIVKINADGMATALKGGAVNITATATIDNKQLSVVKEVIVMADDNSIAITSPNGKSQIQIVHSTITGKLFYRLFQDGDNVVELSSIGQNTSIGDLSEGLEFVSVSKVEEINDTYQMFGGKKDYYTDHCFTKSMTLSKNGVLLTVEARVYDDGGAFRFIVTPIDDEEYTLYSVGTEYGEKTTMSVPKNSTVWSTIMPSTTGKCSPHEQLGEETVMKYFDSMRVVPFMYKTPQGTYVYVTEAGMNGQYAGVILRSIDSLSMRFSLSNQQQEDIKVSGKYTSSWRTFATGTLQMVYATEIIENVSDPCKIEDTSWITPGVTSWSWMEGVNNYWSQGGSTNSSLNAFDMQQGLQRDKETIKKYIDLSVEMGWEYFCMDDGWQPYISLDEARKKGYTINEWANFSYYYDGFFDWTQEVCDYAKERGIGLIAWIHTGIMDTEEKMDNLFSALSNFGIKGIKVDFFDSEEQWIIDLWQLIYKKAAQYKLLVNVHGANKPTGERRTWPNVINREAIFGEEMNKTLSSNMVIQAVLRSICGPADFTPYFYPVGGESDIYMSGQIALPIIYESGITCFASAASDYEKLTQEMKFFYTDFPEAWDESIFLSGEVGRNVSVARKGRDIERWYVGGLTVNARTDTIDCSFLDANRNYNAYIYYGGDKKTTLEYKIESVTSKSKINVSAIANGGYAILIAPTEYSNGYEIVYSSLSGAKYKLNKYIARAKGLQSSVYTATSFNEVVLLLNEATTLYNSSSATVFQLNEKSLELKQAMEKVVKVGNAENLQTKLAEAKKLNGANYSLATYSVLANAITEVEALNFNDLTQTEIDGYITKLDDAINALIRVYGVTVSNEANKGSITGVSDGSSYEDGDELTITITAKEDYKIKSIKLNDGFLTITNSKVMTFTHIVTNETTLQVEYEEEVKLYAVTVNDEPSKGSVTGVVGGALYEDGTKLTIGVIANEGYVIKNIKVNGNTVTVTNSKAMTFTHTVTNETILQVEYEEEVKSYTVTVINDDSQGSISGVENKTYTEGTVLDIKVSAKDGYTIKSIVFGSKEIKFSSPVEISFSEKVNAEVTIVVIYEKEVVQEQPSADNGGGCGCGSSIGGVSTIALSLIALACASVLIFKRKEN